MTSTAAGALHPHRLPNGLRVLLAPDRRWARVAVALHVGAGFRSERPGEEGLAHLVEHMLFEGSERVPGGALRSDVHRLGGIVNGTTHQDYTDFYQVVPESSLERALFREADRLRAPAFTSARLATQLDVVGAEISQRTGDHPYAGLPWPLLPRILFTRHANAHDGYGNADQLRGTSVDDCASFFWDHYAPGNAVLTVAGAFDADDALAMVERHFADIPGRPAVPAPEVTEGHLAADRWEEWTDRGVPRSAMVLGYRLPDPAGDLEGYLAHVVLARLVAEEHRDLGGAPLLSTECGFFGPLDTRDPDVLVVTGMLPPGERPDRLLAGLRAGLRSWGDGGLSPTVVGAATRSVADSFQLMHTELATRARALGRLELLLGRAETVDDVPALVASLPPDAVSAAAAIIADRATAGVLVLPGAERTRPLPPPIPGRTPRGPGAAALARTAPEPRPLPGRGRRRLPARPALAESTSRGGTRIIAIGDRRGAQAHIRARFPLGRSGWSSPATADLLAALLDGAVRDEAARRALPGQLSVGTDGQWLSVSGLAPAGSATAWLDALVSALDPALLASGATEPGPAPMASRPPDRVVEDIQRTLWLGRPEDPPAPADLLDDVLALGRGVLVVVGDVDVEQVSAAGRAGLSQRYRGGAAGGPVAECRTVPGGAVEAVPVPGLADVHVLLSSFEPAGGASEGARYLATAVLGGYHDSRLARRARAAGRPNVPLVGRDVVLDRPRVFVRARTSGDAVDELLADVGAGTRELVLDPPGDEEIERARVYCEAQLLSAHDSPVQLADTVVATAANGRPADWLWQLPQVLRATPTAAVAAAARELFAEQTLDGVLFGAVSRTSRRIDAAIPS